MSEYSYQGEIAAIVLGVGGLFTDAAQSNIPATNLIRANNVTFYNGVLQKDYGSRTWNQEMLPSGIRRFCEMFPDNQGREQRVFALTEDGEVFRMPNNYTNELVTPQGTAPEFLNAQNYTCMIVGGNELQNNPKKLFIFTGYDPVQVVSGDTTVRHTISKPPADWSGTNQPFWGVFHRGRLFAGGCPNAPHQVYVSSATDHEDFLTSQLTMSVYPGESDTLVGGGVFRGRLYAGKFPLGIFYLVDDNADSNNWFFAKFGDDFGACSPQSFNVSGDDLIVANNYGSLTSMAAAFKFGDIATSDIFNQLGIRRFTEDQIRPDAIFQRDMIYYGMKRQYFVSFQSYMNPFPDRMLCMNIKDTNAAPKLSFIDKDQPNCLGMLRDTLRVPRPFYGARDGFIYQMDVPDRWVGPQGGTSRRAYTLDAQTPHMDFSQGNTLLGAQVKQFDFIQLEYEPTGDWNVEIEVYIDSRFRGSYLVNLAGRSNLDELPLTNSQVDALVEFSDRVPIVGEGKRISLRFKQSGLGQDVRLVKAYIYYRVEDQQQTVG